jgi:drug/metabolite transporter (DMT)-like permease
MSLVFRVAGTEARRVTARHRLLAVLVAVLWGANFLAIHLGLDHMPPLFFAGLRMLVIAVPTVVFVPRPQVPLRWLIGYGIGFGTLQFVFLFIAMDVGMPTGLASLVLQASAPCTVLLGAVFLRERLTARQGIGIGLAVLGLAAIAASRAQSAALLPVLLTLCGALGWAFGNLCNRLAAPPKPMHLTLWMCVVPVVPLFAASALVEGNGCTSVPTLFTAEGLPGLGALLYVALLATVVGSGIWTWLMRRYPAGVVAPYSLLVPVVGIALSAAVLGEQPSVVELGSAVLIVGGVLLGTPRAIRTEPDDVVGTEVEPARTRLSW